MLTVEQIAEIANTTVKYVRREIAAGNLPAFKPNNRYLVNADDFKKWQFRTNRQLSLFPVASL